MKENKVIVFLVALFTFFLFFGKTEVKAMGFGSNNPNFITELSKKIGINQDKLQSAFDSIRSDKQKEMEKNYEDRLDQAVKDKKITEAQKKLILQKHNELKKQQESYRSAKTQQKQDLKTWAEKNNIDSSYLYGGLGKGMMHGYNK